VGDDPLVEAVAAPPSEVDGNDARSQDVAGNVTGDEIRATTGVLIGGRYEIVRLLGRGGMGEVFVARDRRFGRREVAIKLMAEGLQSIPELRLRFAREAEALDKVESHHIVKVTDHGTTDDGREFFVMEYLRGHDLARILKNGGPLKPERAVALVEQALLAIAAAHSVGIVHRDLKPSNMVVTVEGKDERKREHLRVLDFGIAKQQDMTGQQTEAGRVFGTEGYMAPEARLGRIQEGQAHLVDIYGMGVVLYELLRGRRPFASSSPSAEAREQLAAAAPPRLGDGSVPVWLDGVLARAMAVNPEDRFQSAEQFLDALLAGGDVDIGNLPAGTIVDDKFRIEEQLGRGGVGVVYSALDIKFDRRCALKFLQIDESEEAWEVQAKRFYKESLAEKVGHPNVVRVFSHGRWAGRPYLALERLDGQTLGYCWAEVDWGGFLQVLRDVAEALDASHAAGVVHRDVAPDNIMVLKTGRAKLFDFGFGRSNTGAEITRPSVREDIGRYGYVAPEQFLDPSGVDGRADQWPVAAIVYERLCGRVPFQAPGEEVTGNALMKRKLRAGAVPEAPIGENHPLNGVVLRGLAREPADRFATVSEFVQALEAAAPPSPRAESPVSSSPVTPNAWARTGPVTEVGGRGRRAWVAAALVVAVGAATATAFWRPWASDAPPGSSAGAPAPSRDTASAPLAAIVDKPTGEPAEPPATESRAAIPGPADAGAEAARQVDLAVTSKVAGATVTVEGARHPLPTVLTRPSGSHVTATVERRGYRDKTVELVFDSDREVAVDLEPVKRPTPAPPSSPGVRRKVFNFPSNGTPAAGGGSSTP
jgi:serine/threonine protein kinase